MEVDQQTQALGGFKMTTVKPIKLPPLWAWCLFLLVLWQITLWAQNPGLMSDDSGEMVAAAYGLGLPHPPGYPLFCLLGRLFSLVPVGIVAFRLNLLSSLFVLLSLAFVGVSALKISSNKEAAGWKPTFLTIAVLLFLFSCRSVFAQALTAKGGVYTLTLLFLSFFWWLRVRNEGKGLSTPLFLFLWFLWAVGMTNHWESQVLWVPFLVYWGWQEKFQWGIKRTIQGLSVLLIGLSTYLYLPLRAAQKPGFCWGNPMSLSEFWWVVSRKLASGSEPLFRSSSYYLSFMGEYLKVLGSHWLPGILLFALWGAFCLYRSNRALFCSSLMFYLPMVLGVLMIPREETRFLVGVYLVPTQALMAFYLSKGLVDQKERIGRIAVVFLLIAACGWCFWTFHHENKSRYTASSDLALNAVKFLPARSIFLADSDIYVMPLVYEREVEGKRKDLVFQVSHFLLHDWGWAQLGAQEPKAPRSLNNLKELPAHLEALTSLVDGRGLFLDLREMQTSFPKRFNGYWFPWALTQKWGQKEPGSDEVIRSFDEKVALERHRDLDETFDAEDVTTHEIQMFYTQQYFDMGFWFRQKGDLDHALVFIDKGHELDPALNMMGPMAGLCAQKGYFKLAMRLNQKAIEANPYDLGAYINLAHLYLLDGNVAQARAYLDLGLNKNDENPSLTSEGKKGVRRHWEGSWEEMVKTTPPMRDKTLADYGRLIEWFNREGAVFLSNETRAAIMEKAP